MSDWSETPQTTLVDRLTPVPLDQRQSLRQGTLDKAEHDRWFDSIPSLRQIEIGGATPSRKGIKGAARVAFWNVERLRHLDTIADSLRVAAPDVMLLCEIDRGMARSGNSDRVVEIAAELGVGYTYAAEFIELDLGDVHEKTTHAGKANADGFHGASILSDVALRHPFLIRIDRRGNWFGLERHEPRVGGRIAIGVTVNVGGVQVAMVNVHLESHEDPMARAGDMARLLAQVDLVARGGPVILGGDFNTSTRSHAERLEAPELWQAKIAADPMRLLRPMSHEPLFAVAATYGYDWVACNVADMATTRYPQGSTRPPAKIDWFFTRGLVASEPAIIPALCPDGSPSSDHDGLLVTVRPV